MEREQCSIIMGINMLGNGLMVNVKEKVSLLLFTNVILLAKYFYINGDEFEGTYAND